MKASEFLTRHRINAVAEPLVAYTCWPGGNQQSTVTRLAWAMALVRRDADGVTGRVLRLTHESGAAGGDADPGFDTDDWDEFLPSLVFDIGYGAMPFDEYVVEGYSSCSDPVQAYEKWQGLVWLRIQVETWLRGDTKLREDFYLIGTE